MSESSLRNGEAACGFDLTFNMLAASNANVSQELLFVGSDIRLSSFCSSSQGSNVGEGVESGESLGSNSSEVSEIAGFKIDLRNRALTCVGSRLSSRLHGASSSGIIIELPSALIRESGT